MILTQAQKDKLHELAFAEVSNKDIAEQMGLPLTEIHAARHRMGITIDKVAAAIATTKKPFVNPEFEAAVQQMDTVIAERDKSTEPQTCMTCQDCLCRAKGTNCIVPDCQYYMSKIDQCKQVLAVHKQELLSCLAYWGTDCMEKCAVEELRSVLNRHIPENWRKYHA